MRPFTSITCLAFLLINALADLSCLKWDLLLNPIGLICHFEPEVYSELTDSVSAAINATYTAANNLLHFAVTHHPATVEYEYIRNIETGGFAQANQGLVNVTHDYTQVGIGFGKDLINTGVQIFNLLDWSDLAGCVIGDSVRAHQGIGSIPLSLNQVPSNSSNIAVAAAPSNTSDMALGIWSKCMKAKFSKPVAFNITEPNEKVGRTISEVAQLLLPFEAPESAGAKLSIAERADADVYLWGKSSTTGEFFPDIPESQSVADALRDPEYEKKSCIPLFPPAGAISAKRTVENIHRRTDSLGLGCRPPTSKPEGIDNSRPLYRDMEGPGRGDVLDEPPFELELRDPTTEEGAKEFLQDLHDKSVGQIIFKAIDMSFLKRVREIFEGPKTTAAYKALKIHISRDGAPVASSHNFLDSTEDGISFLNAVVRPVRSQIHAFASKLLPHLDPEKFDVTISLIYYPKARYKPTRVIFKEWHRDKAILAFGTADYSGLNFIKAGMKPFYPGFELSSGQAAFSLKPQEHILSGWAGEGWEEVEGDDQVKATWHSVWGKDMADHGRLSMLCIVHPKR